MTASEEEHDLMRLIQMVAAAIAGDDVEILPLPDGAMQVEGAPVATLGAMGTEGWALAQEIKIWALGARRLYLSAPLTRRLPVYAGFAGPKVAGYATQTYVYAARVPKKKYGGDDVPGLA